MGNKPIHDLILQDRKTLSPPAPPKVSKKEIKRDKKVKFGMEKPILDLNSSLHRDTADPSSNAKFLNQVKSACLEFKTSRIAYKNNTFNQKELIDVNQGLLMNLQSMLAQSGAYDEYFKSHEGKSFYIQSLNEIASKANERNKKKPYEKIKHANL